MEERKMNAKPADSLQADPKSIRNMEKTGEGTCVDARYIGKRKIEYEILFGNENIVFIKAGTGGGARGYENKYLRMARRINKRLGATVICASNPAFPHTSVDEEEIRWVMAEKSLTGCRLYFVGTSDGGYQVLSLAEKFPETVKILGINPSFISLNDLVMKLRKLPDVEKVFVFGSKDEDYEEVLPLKNAKIDNFKFVTAEGADHSFRGMTEEFIQLVDIL